MTIIAVVPGPITDVTMSRPLFIIVLCIMSLMVTLPHVTAFPLFQLDDLSLNEPDTTLFDVETRGYRPNRRTSLLSGKSHMCFVSASLICVCDLEGRLKGCFRGSSAVMAIRGMSGV